MVLSEVKNRVQLWQRDPDVGLDDHRARPFEPLAVGHVAMLSFRTEHGRGPGYTHEFAYVRVVAVDAGKYRGEVVGRVRADLISPEKLATGTVLDFGESHIFAAFDTQPEY